MQRAIDRGFGLWRAVQRAVERGEDCLDRVRVATDHQRAKQLKFRCQRLLDRAHVRDRGGIAEALIAVIRGETQHVAVAHRAGGKREAPGRVLLAHRAGRDLKVPNDHQASSEGYCSCGSRAARMRSA
jgi:hypothetical protein